MYTYSMVQVPPNISIAAKGQKGNEAAAYLQGVVNQKAEDGWEFQRVDAIGVNVEAGCLAGLFGQKNTYQTYYVITFRKPA